MKPYRVALAGYYGFGNLGDELLAEAMLAALLRCGVERGSVVLLTNDPAGAEKKFGTAAVSRWSAGEVWRALGQSDTLLLGGGGLFQDASSLRSCLYYWGLVRMAELRGATPWALGQSVGPFSTRLGRWLARDALRRCRAVQARDEAALSLCREWGLPAEAGHDPVLSLGGAFRALLSARQERPDPPERASPKLLVNLRPCPNGLPERFAEAIAPYARSFAGEAVGVALSGEDERLMRRLIDEGRLSLTGVVRLTSLEDAACVFHGAGAALGMRLHFAVLAALAGTPLAAAPYDPKVEAFAASRGVPLWREGPLPEPKAPEPSSAGPQELDALCRRILGV